MEEAPLYDIVDASKQRPGDRGYSLCIKHLQIAKGDKIALTGPSGCGKSTTLDILGLGLRPDGAKRFHFAPNSGHAQKPLDIITAWSRNAHDRLADLRLKYMGYVLQSGELLPFLKAGENMELTARLAGAPPAEAKERAMRLAILLGIEKLYDAMPATLSVGERQRAAIARALAPHPQVILADEPTAALDPLHAEKVMTAFLDALAQFGSTLILVTHNAAWAEKGGLRQVPFQLVKNGDGVMAIVDDRNSQSEKPC